MTSEVPWCCRHRLTVRYIAVVVTVELLIMLVQLFWGGPL